MASNPGQNEVITGWSATYSKGGNSMGLIISCIHMGYDCDHEISGDSFSDMLANIQQHAIEEHGVPEEVAHSAEKIDEWKGAIRQSALPGSVRTPRTIK